MSLCTSSIELNCSKVHELIKGSVSCAPQILSFGLLINELMREARRAALGRCRCLPGRRPQYLLSSRSPTFGLRYQAGSELNNDLLYLSRLFSVGDWCVVESWVDNSIEKFRISIKHGAPTVPPGRSVKSLYRPPYTKSRTKPKKVGSTMIDGRLWSEAGRSDGRQGRRRWPRRWLFG